MLKAELDFIILKEGLRASHARSHVYVKYKLSLFEVLKSLFIERRAETGGTVPREWLFGRRTGEYFFAY